MAKLYIYDTECQIKGEFDAEFLRELDQELSFFVQGAEHTRAFRGYVDRSGKFVKWDGRKHLLSRKLSFQPGLVSRVLAFFKFHHKDIVEIDSRSEKSQAKSIDIIPVLRRLGKDPYPYQTEAATATEANDRGIIRLATGGGKSLIAALITAKFGKKTIIYVIGKDLLYQIHDLFTSVFGTEIGLVGDGHCAISDINVATVWTVGQAIGMQRTKIQDEKADEKVVDPQRYKDIRQMMSDAKVHIFDECHVSACGTIQEITDNIKPEHIYGMSASPWRDDGADILIEAALGKPIVDFSASYLIKRGYLVKPIIKFLPVPPYGAPLARNYNTIYKHYIVENEVRNALVSSAAVRLVEQGYQTLVLYNSIQHGELLHEEIAQKIPCVLLSGKDDSKTRKRAKEGLENKTLNCIIASKIFDIGIDLPSLSGLVVAGSGKSSVRALQRIGRVIRKYPGKKIAAVVDFYDQADFVEKHSRARKKIYQTEEEFEVIWPKKKREKKEK